MPPEIVRKLICFEKNSIGIANGERDIAIRYSAGQGEVDRNYFVDTFPAVESDFVVGVELDALIRKEGR